MYLCPECAAKNEAAKPPLGVLSTLYDYKTIKAKHPKRKLFDKIRQHNYTEILPFSSHWDGVPFWPTTRPYGNGGLQGYWSERD